MSKKEPDEVRARALAPEGSQLRSVTQSFSEICEEPPSDYFAEPPARFSSAVAKARCDSAFLGAPQDVTAALLASQQELLVRKNDGYACGARPKRAAPPTPPSSAASSSFDDPQLTRSPHSQND